MLEEIERITREPVTAEELLTAKKSFIDTFPNNFASASQVVSAFAGDEMIGRYAKQPDYWANYRDNIEVVDIAAVQRVAKRRLKLGQVIILIVGQKEEILKGHPDHPVNLGRLAKGGVKELPMRDPLTMQPIEVGPKTVFPCVGLIRLVTKPQHGSNWAISEGG